MPGLVAVFFMLAADVPKTPQFFFGAGVGWAHAGSQDFPSCCGTGSGPDGLALSLEAQIEYGRFFAAASLVFAQNLTTESGMVTGRLGVYLLNATFSPYLAAGAGFLRETLLDGDAPPNAIEASGAAVLAEAGLSGLRSWRAGRVNAYVQVLQPLFDDPPSPGHQPPSTKTCLLAGIRLFY